MEPFDRYFLKRMLVQVGGVIAIAAILGGFVLAYNATYRTAANLDQAAEGQWMGIARELHERYAGIPGLAAGLGPALASDAPALAEVTGDLNRWEAAMASGEMGRISLETTNLEASLSDLTRALAAHPEAAAPGYVREFLAVLEETGAEIPADQARFNEAVREYNRAISSFPGSMWTENWGFTRRDYFTAGIGGRDPPPLPPE